MDTVLSLLLVIVLLVAVGLAIALLVGVLRRRKTVQGLRERSTTVDPMAAGPLVSDPRKVKAGDVVVIEETEYIVRGTLTMDEDGYTWKEHLLDASGVERDLRRWLSVEEGESGIEVVLWDRVPGADLAPDTEVTLNGVTYRRDEKGEARFASTGTTGAATDGTMSYADYLQPGGDGLLSLEKFGTGASWETSTGRALNLEALNVLHS